MTTQASSNITYELHSLGWKAFQDLCVTILTEILGQTVQSFLPNRDGGRDGAFCGSWTPSKGENLVGSFTVQCKFSVKRDSTLTFSHIDDEFEKAKRLAEKGLAHNYILITNHTLTGAFEEDLRTRFLSIDGIKNFLPFGNEWITSKIKESSRLRMLVPRVYGLGDLSQILDERAYIQAQNILESMGNDLAKFVITSAHRRSAKALLQHGFVLLLGEPASGKSTIAASLAVGAVDIWGCSTIKARSAEDFARHWNPHEPKQFFWIDDVFGVTQYQRLNVDEWNRTFNHLAAAIRRGARVLFTSRDYIFKAAQLDLKRSAFPLLENSQVIINVQDLSKDEREQILYNHIKLGNQPLSFKTAIRPFLRAAAANNRFLPESARRLGDRVFTKGLIINASSVKEFVEKPRSFMRDTLTSLDQNSHAAIALIFMNGGFLNSPIKLGDDEQNTLRLLGGTVSGVRQALSSLNGSILKFVRTEEGAAWTYKHPTISDAFSSIIAEDPELLDIYLLGTPIQTLISEVVCGEAEVPGAKVIIGSSHYELLISRLCSLPNRGQLYYFLAVRTGKSFLECYLNHYPETYDQLADESITYNYQNELLIKLFELGMLPENIRRAFVKRVSDLAVETPDADFLTKRIRALFTAEELEHILERIRGEVLPYLYDAIWDWKSNYSRPDDAEDYFGPLLETLERFGDEFSGDKTAEKQIREAIDRVNTIIEDTKVELSDGLDERYFYKGEDSFDVANETTPRDIFDDVDK